jgi:putative transposase
LYYYTPKEREINESLITVVKSTFEQNKCVYGHKKLLISLRKKGISIGKEKLSRIMKEEKLISKYVRRRKPKSAENTVNNDEIENKVERKFNDRKPLEVVASDLTYVDVNNKWHYICLLIELSHREIIGFSAGRNKDAELVKAAWLTVRSDIRDICIFHTDRGSEFKNEEIDKILEIGNIERSLSRPGKPVDNAVCESMYDIVKTEFIFEESFKDLEDLQAKLTAWVWWYNNERIHSSLGYKTPVESRKTCEIGVTDDKIANKKYQNFWKKIALHGQKVEIDK